MNAVSVLPSVNRVVRILPEDFNASVDLVSSRIQQIILNV
jgi:hypothetical protein